MWVPFQDELESLPITYFIVLFLPYQRETYAPSPGPLSTTAAERDAVLRCWGWRGPSHALASRPPLLVALVTWLRSELITRTDKLDKRFNGVTRELADLRERMRGHRAGSVEPRGEGCFDLDLVTRMGFRR